MVVLSGDGSGGDEENEEDEGGVMVRGSGG